LLRLQNIRFFLLKKELRHNHPHLASADSVSITFEFQKSDEKNITITIHHSGDVTLCHARAWSSIVQRLWADPTTTWLTHVNTYRNENGDIRHVESKSVVAKLRAAARRIGEAELGYPPSDIGTHSIRSGFAMAMYLAGARKFSIMLQGRWGSDSFLKYIRPQVQQFSTGLSARMIATPDFYTIPDFVHYGDNRIPDTIPNSSGRNSITGLTAQNRSMFPALHLRH
jgi:hypothetical protein